MLIVIILKIKGSIINSLFILRNQIKEEKVLESVWVDPLIPLVLAKPIDYGIIGIEQSKMEAW